MGKKVGYLYTNVSLVPTNPEQAISVNHFVMRAQVGAKVAERSLKETRIFEAKPHGRLLSFVVEQAGDGGDQTLEGTATPTGLKVLQKRPGQPNQVRSLKPVKETVEDADQARVALIRKQAVEGIVTDGTDLESYRVVTTPGGTETRTIGGAPVKVTKVTTLSDKEKVPAVAYLDEQGRMLEIDFGGTMTAVQESEEKAKRFDTVEVFGLTRLVLPKPAPPEARNVPGQLTLDVTGLPEKFRIETYRQSFKVLDGGKVQITLKAAPPKVKGKVRPLVDPNGGVNLKSTLAVEADSPEIAAAAKKIVGTEKDAYVAAKKIVAWVNQSLQKDYGSSSDRATDVLRIRKGDCTEHSLLAVALLRAAGIPAKRIDGVVYLMNEDKVPALYWHEWVEAYVGEWTQLDPTFGQDVADATHLALGEEGSAEITPLIGGLKVVDVR
ncbi:MAG: transglutaminase-like domain-containing protein [Myxococcaceae bacterium]|nr:transglutaminase-like domain-containing protein [Myxococcaceae bacterium]